MDSYCFPIPCDQASQAREPLPSRDTSQRDFAWFQTIKEIPGGISRSSLASLPPLTLSKLKFLTRQGFPVAYRYSLYLSLIPSGSPLASLPASQPTVPRSVQRDIEKDKGRSFPGHPFFDLPSSQSSLSRILLQFASSHPSVGYAQGLDRVAGVFLLLFGEGESAHLLSHFVTTIIPRGTFDLDMAGRHAEALALEHLLRSLFPQTHSKLTDLGVDLNIATEGWMSCAFCGAFRDTEFTLRLWDVAMVEGGTFLMRVAIALFELNKTKIKGCTEQGEAFTLILGMAQQIENIDELITTACRLGLGVGGFFGRKDLEGLDDEIRRLRLRYYEKVTTAQNSENFKT